MAGSQFEYYGLPKGAANDLIDNERKISYL